MITIVTIFIIYWLSHILLWGLYTKANKPGWHTLVPVLQDITLLEICGKPKWQAVLSLIPFINFFVAILWVAETLNSFGKRSFLDHCKGLALGSVFLPLWGFSKDVQYEGPSGINDRKNKIRKSAGREWADAIIYAFFAAALIRMFMLEAYKIPTGSMEGSLLTGDFLFVSKFHYGPRIPNTPLAFPFAHHTMPLIKTKAYSEAIKLKYRRLPGFGKVKRYDPVVFNYPEGDTVSIEFQSRSSYYELVKEKAFELESIDRASSKSIQSKNFYINKAKKYLNERMPMVVRPVDKKENFIKRCVGIPGDELELKAGELYVNGELAWKPKNMQITYKVISSTNKMDKVLKKCDVGFDQYIPKRYASAYPKTYYLNEGQVEKLEENKAVHEVIRAPNIFESKNSWQFETMNNWNSDNFSKIKIPAKGWTVNLDNSNLNIYRRAITAYEHNDLKVDANGTITINGEVTNEYTFKMDYYFMMGDNRHNSIDSRYWGFVPEDHIVGKPMFVWLSIEPRNFGSYKNEHNFFQRIRFERFFKPVKGKFINGKIPKD